MRKSVILEICADSVESALAAERGGAHRIELCSGLVEGGTTPSCGLISTVRNKVSIPIHVMVRPRHGDFCYGTDDYEAMKQDVLTARRLGADGVVFGILKQDGRVDMDRTRQLLKLVRPLKITFHRAFDMSRNLDEALETLIATGVDRILTSGGKQRVEDGIPTVKALAKSAAGRLVIMAGGGISESNAHRVIRDSGVAELHASASVLVSSQMLYRNENIALGGIKGREYHRALVTEDKVRRLLLAAANGNCHTEKAR
ncbi:MAG: copper homeostasis protein CutC [Acidobacteria bacterium]|nr:copper homeostasis protein CutC [Acidobacteriota bacterium]